MQAPDTVGGCILRPIGSFKFKAPAKAWEPDPPPLAVPNKRPNTRARRDPRVITKSRTLPSEREAFRSALLGCAVKLKELDHHAQVDSRKWKDYGANAAKYLAFLRETSQRMPLLGKDLRSLLAQVAAQLERLTFFRGADGSSDIGTISNISDYSDNNLVTIMNSDTGILYRDQALGSLEELKSRNAELATLKDNVAKLSDERFALDIEANRVRKRLQEIKDKLSEEKSKHRALEQELHPLRREFAVLEKEKNEQKHSFEAIRRDRLHIEDDLVTLTSMIEHEKDELKTLEENIGLAIKGVRKGAPREDYEATAREIECKRIEERELEKENEELLAHHVAILHTMALYGNEQRKLLAEKEVIEESQADFLRAHTPRPKWQEGAVIASEVNEFVNLLHKDAHRSRQREREGQSDGKFGSL